MLDAAPEFSCSCDAANMLTFGIIVTSNICKARINEGSGVAASTLRACQWLAMSRRALAYGAILVARADLSRGN